MFSNRLASHLERGVVGFPTTLASSVGLIMASPVILTVTSGFGMGGDTFALAVLLAFIMMQAQVTTFAEAATLIPTTGSVYDYISCGMGRFFAITGALCAYLIVHIFAGTAETILAGIMALVNFESINAQMAAHQNTWMVGVGMVVIFGLLNAIGVEIFGKVEVVLTFGMWTTLTIFGLCGIFMAPVTHLSGWFGTPLNVSDINSLFGYIGMAMFMFVGCELVTPMAPEIKQAHRTIPRAMALGLLGVASCMFIYGAAINRQVENTVLDAANNVHLLDTPMAIPAFAERVMGHAGQYWLGVGLLLAGCATINTLMAAVPRIIYGMALDGGSTLTQDGKGVNSQVNYTVNSLKLQGQDMGSGKLTLKVDNVDGQAWHQFSQQYSAQSQALLAKPELAQNPELYQQALTETLFNALPILLKGNPSVTISPLSWRNAKGESTLNLSVLLKDPAQVTAPPQTLADSLDRVVQSLDGKVVIPVDMATEFMTKIAGLEGYQPADAAKLADQQVKGLAAMGQMFRITTMEDNAISSSLQYANGQVTLNGQKMPLQDFAAMFGLEAPSLPDSAPQEGLPQQDDAAPQQDDAAPQP